MHIERLVGMANNIGLFFHGEAKGEEEIAGIVNHLQKFWEVRMRRQIKAYVDQDGGADLAEPVREAVRRLTV
jgi:formate dehydrogenase subunit delta